MWSRARKAGIVLLISLVGALGLSQGVVFEDLNRNGLRDAGEPGLAGVAVSDGVSVVLTGSDGTFTLPGGEQRNPVFVSPPSGWWTDRFWLPPDA